MVEGLAAQLLGGSYYGFWFVALDYSRLKCPSSHTHHEIRAFLTSTEWGLSNA